MRRSASPTRRRRRSGCLRRAMIPDKALNSRDITTSNSLAPRSVDDLAAALRDASERDRPVIPWGAGTLQRLGAAPPHGALALHTTALDRLLEYNPADLTVTVEAGITLDALQAALTRHG